MIRYHLFCKNSSEIMQLQLNVDIYEKLIYQRRYTNKQKYLNNLNNFKCILSYKLDYISIIFIVNVIY